MVRFIETVSINVRSDNHCNFWISCRWLIEVNASPSLTASSQSDYELKCRLLEDMLHIVDMENRCQIPSFFFFFFFQYASFFSGHTCTSQFFFLIWGGGGGGSTPSSPVKSNTETLQQGERRRR